jgi:hypothetical protein
VKVAETRPRFVELGVNFRVASSLASHAANARFCSGDMPRSRNTNQSAACCSTATVSSSSSALRQSVRKSGSFQDSARAEMSAAAQDAERELGVDRMLGNPQRLGDRAMRASLDSAQPENFATTRRQRSDGFGEDGEFFFMTESLGRNAAPL